MRFWFASLMLVVAIIGAGCSRDDKHRDSAAREAGKAAYKLAQDTRQAAKKADQELRKASREARDGWNEAKRDAQTNKK